MYSITMPLAIIDIFHPQGMDSWICSRLFSILNVWLWLGPLELVLLLIGLGLGSRLWLGLGLVLTELKLGWGTEYSACNVYLSVPNGK